MKIIRDYIIKEKVVYEVSCLENALKYNPTFNDPAEAARWIKVRIETDERVGPIMDLFEQNNIPVEQKTIDYLDDTTQVNYPEGLAVFWRCPYPDQYNQDGDSTLKIKYDSKNDILYHKNDILGRTYKDYLHIYLRGIGDEGSYGTDGKYDALIPLTLVDKFSNTTDLNEYLDILLRYTLHRRYDK